MRARDLLRGRLKVLLAERQMSQRDLGKAIGMKDSGMSGVMRGTRAIGFDKLDALAHTLNVTVAELFLSKSDLIRHRLAGGSTHAQSREELARSLAEEAQAATAALADVLAERLESETEPPRPPAADGDRRNRKPRR